MFCLISNGSFKQYCLIQWEAEKVIDISCLKRHLIVELQCQSDWVALSHWILGLWREAEWGKSVRVIRAHQLV